MNVRRGLAGIAILAVLVVGTMGAACASEGSATPVQTDEVDMPRSYRFDPETIEIAAGTTVTWHNSDNFTHTVHLLDGSDVDQKVEPGESTSITFDEPGEYKYECSLHSRDMRGKVIVTEQ